MIVPIPAIDILGGKCVRLSQGDYASGKVYSEDPVEVAKGFERLGFRRLHIVDLDGAKAAHIVNLRVLEAIAEDTSLEIDFGGGIKTDTDLQSAFSAGAAMVTIGSVAAKEPDLFGKWLCDFGPGRIILGADAKDGRVAVAGWKEDSGQELLDFIGRYVAMGVENVLCTDISKDGMLSGPALPLYENIMATYPGIKLIASGGVASEEDIDRLNAVGIYGVVFGKAIYEGRVDLSKIISKYGGHTC